jgi:hypothetical protein
MREVGCNTQDACAGRANQRERAAGACARARRAPCAGAPFSQCTKGVGPARKRVEAAHARPEQAQAQLYGAGQRTAEWHEQSGPANAVHVSAPVMAALRRAAAPPPPPPPTPRPHAAGASAESGAGDGARWEEEEEEEEEEEAGEAGKDATEAAGLHAPVQAEAAARLAGLAGLGWGDGEGSRWGDEDLRRTASTASAWSVTTSDAAEEPPADPDGDAATAAAGWGGRCRGASSLSPQRRRAYSPSRGGGGGRELAGPDEAGGPAWAGGPAGAGGRPRRCSSFVLHPADGPGTRRTADGPLAEAGE